MLTKTKKRRRGKTRKLKADDIEGENESLEELIEKLAVTVDLEAFKATAQQVVNVHDAAQVHCNDGVSKMN